MVCQKKPFFERISTYKCRVNYLVYERLYVLLWQLTSNIIISTSLSQLNYCLSFFDTYFLAFCVCYPFCIIHMTNCFIYHAWLNFLQFLFVFPTCARMFDSAQKAQYMDGHRERFIRLVYFSYSQCLYIYSNSLWEYHMVHVIMSFSLCVLKITLQKDNFLYTAWLQQYS